MKSSVTCSRPGVCPAAGTAAGTRRPAVTATADKVPSRRFFIVLLSANGSRDLTQTLREIYRTPGWPDKERLPRRSLHGAKLRRARQGRLPGSRGAERARALEHVEHLTARHRAVVDPHVVHAVARPLAPNGLQPLGED